MKSKSHLGFQGKAKTQIHLKSIGRGPSPGKLWALRNKEKRSSDQPLKEKIAGEPREKIEPGYLGIPKSLGSSGYAVGPGWE